MFDSDRLPCLVVLGIWCIFMGFGLVVLFILGIWDMVYFYFFSWVYNVTILDVSYDQVTSPSRKIFIWHLTIITDLLPKCLIHILIKYHEYFSFCQSVLPEQRHVNCNECNMYSEYKITDTIVIQDSGAIRMTYILLFFLKKLDIFLIPSAQVFLNSMLITW